MPKILLGIEKCPHLDCLVYHYGNPCTCDMKRYCHLCNPIESEKKDDRCTKCNGVGKLTYTDKKTYSELGTCTHCNGTGKEPRKEECSACKNPPDDTYHTCLEEPRKEDLCDCCGNDFHDCSCETTQWEINELEAKLSRYKSALTKISELYVRSHGKYACVSDEACNIAYDALAEEKCSATPESIKNIKVEKCEPSMNLVDSGGASSAIGVPFCHSCGRHL